MRDAIQQCGGHFGVTKHLHPFAERGTPDFVWINTLLGNVKNALHGTYHALRRKYLQRYLSEFCYRFDLAALVPRLLHAAAHTPPLPYKFATAGV